MLMGAAHEVVSQLHESAVARRTAAPVVHRAMAVGDYHRQGDVYVQRIARLPNGAMEVPVVAQLVPGHTQGARHCLASLDGVAMYRLAAPTALDGPIVKCERPVAITHPEHGDVTIPRGTYRITYQRQYADELRRVAD